MENLGLLVLTSIVSKLFALIDFKYNAILIIFKKLFLMRVEEILTK